MRYLDLLEAIDVSNSYEVSNRIDLYNKIIAQSHHEGERANARTMRDRLIARAEETGSYRAPPPPPRRQPPRPAEKPPAPPKPVLPIKVEYLGYYKPSNALWGWGVMGEEIFRFWGGLDDAPYVKVLPKTMQNLRAVDKIKHGKVAKGFTDANPFNYIEWLEAAIARRNK